MKRGDHGRRRTTSRIKHGGGDGGEPVRSHHGSWGSACRALEDFPTFERTARTGGRLPVLCSATLQFSYFWQSQSSVGRGEYRLQDLFDKKTSSHTDHPPPEALTTSIRYSDVIDNFQQTANIVTAESQVEWCKTHRRLTGDSMNKSISQRLARAIEDLPHHYPGPGGAVSQ